MPSSTTRVDRSAETAAAIGGHLMVGFLKEFGPDPIPPYHNGGFVGLVSDVMDCVQQLLDGWNLEDDHPGIYMYEVVEEVGKLFARQLQSGARHLWIEPPRIAAEIDAFYLQD